LKLSVKHSSVPDSTGRVLTTTPVGGVIVQRTFVRSRASSPTIELGTEAVPLGVSATMTTSWTASYSGGWYTVSVGATVERETSWPVWASIATTV
jgi:hypothetical protein